MLFLIKSIQVFYVSSFSENSGRLRTQVLNARFFNIKRLGLSLQLHLDGMPVHRRLPPLDGMPFHRRLLPPGWDASPSQVTPPWMGCQSIAGYSPLDGMPVHRRLLISIPSGCPNSSPYPFIILGGERGKSEVYCRVSYPQMSDL